MKLTFGGGASEVGASFLLLQIDGKNIALDCGARMNSDNAMPDFSFIKDYGQIDAILLSHAHMDHSGMLPLLSREYPNAKIYMTHATKDLIRVLLYDSLKIMEVRESEIPVFAETHVMAMMDRILCYSPTYTFRPFLDGNVTVTFYSAGHVAGAVGVYLCGEEGSFFYSGDFSVTPQRTVEGAAFPKLRPDVAVFESTYGDRLHANREVEEDRLIRKIEAVMERKGKLLIPAFSLGRAQEIILTIHRAINKKQLPKEMRVYVDGMVNDICRVFQNNPNYLRTQYGKRIVKGKDVFYNDNVIAVNKNQELRDEIIKSKDGLIILSSSGMLTGGPSQWYAEKLAGDENNAIALTGYQDEESPGRMLLDLLEEKGERQLKLGEKSVPVNCEVDAYGLSAHADKMEILALAHNLGAKRVFLNHGNEEVVNRLGAELQREYNGRIYIPKNGETFDWVVHKKRKQIHGSILGDVKSMPDHEAHEKGEEAVTLLWRFLLDHYGVKRAFTMEDLYYIRYGNYPENERDFHQFKDWINHSAYFETEKKRPFLFHAVSEDGLDLQDADAPMEVNEMLALVDERFPKDTGLYKKGADFDEKTAILSFHFPKAAKKNLKAIFKKFEDETGWKVKVNDDCNQGAAEQLILSLFSTDASSIRKISYYRTDGSFHLLVEKLPDNVEEIQESFYRKTGLSLMVIDRNSTKKIVRADVKSGQMEQNQAFARIEQYFADKPHKIYKKSLKVRDGVSGIELSFISPAVEEWYRDGMDELERQTYWNIWANKEANQHELLKTAGELLGEYGIHHKKLSYMASQNCVQVVLHPSSSALPPDKEEWEELAERYRERTGLRIEIKIDSRCARIIRKNASHFSQL